MTVDDYTRDARCEVCRLTPGLCVCASLPRIDCPLEIILVRHAKEEHSQSNTGSLLHRLLPGSRILRYARGAEPFDASPLKKNGVHVLFPRPGATIATPKVAPAISTLVLLDAKWRQARRMSTRIEALRTAPFLTLPDDVRPRWVLRKPRVAGQVSTIEAAAVALGRLGHTQAADAIWDVLNFVMPRRLHVASKTRRDTIE